MYVTPNFKTKKALREAVVRGDRVTVFNPARPFRDPPRDGMVVVAGPHYPKLHRWYATVRLEDGLVVYVS